MKNTLVAKDQIYTQGNNHKTITTTCVSRGGPRKWKSSNDDHSLAPEVKETHTNMLWEQKRNNPLAATKTVVQPLIL